MTRFTLFISTILLNLVSYGQLVADFSANKTTGCDVLGGVTFTDLSTGNPTSWSWNFGNGNTSILQNPTANFSSPGNYTVTLTVRSGNNTNTITKSAYIKVFRNPVSNLSATPTSGCTPLNVSFTDNSTPGDGIINQWLWDFNDGSPASNQQNPTHTYLTVGQYDVSLKVTDNNGCSNTKLENNLVTPNPKPRALISVTSQRSGCTAPLTVNFISNSVGQNLSYLWNFGDGNSSTQANPTHTYTSLGVYDVSLSVIDQAGCSDSTKRFGYVTIRPVTADFEFLQDSICKGETLEVNNKSVNGSTFQWTFGDGRTSNSSSPSIVFNNAGTYQVKLIASRNGVCADEITKTFYVDSVKAKLNIQPLFVCEDSTIVTFTNQSFNSDSSHYILGGKSYFNINPVSFYGEDGTFEDTLIAVSKLGCIDTVVRNDRSVSITRLDIFSKDFGGCIPHTTRLNSKVESSSPIINYFWEFGRNGSLGTSTDRDSVSYTLNTDTIFKVIATVIDSNGCEAKDSLLIGAGTPPRFTFQQLSDTVCANDTLQAVIKFDLPRMIVLDVIDSIRGDSVEFFYAQDTLNVYGFADTGLTYIKIKNDYNGCKRDTVIEVHVNGPIIYRIKDSINCTNKSQHFFSTNAKDFNRFEWDFGDGSPIVTNDLTPSHTYQNDSSYLVTLTVYNDSTGCDYVLKYITVVDQKSPSIIGGPQIMCIPFDYNLKASLPADTEDFYWLVDGDTIRTDSLVGKMDSAKTLNIEIMAVNQYGCIYNPSISLTGYELKPIILADTSRFCDPSEVVFTSGTNAVVAIDSSFWNFGNGDISDSLFSDTSYYNVEGYYDVTLRQIDINGCSNTTIAKDFIRFFRNIPRFSSRNRTACVGDLVTFTNNSIGDSLTFFWDFGNGQTSTALDTSIRYNAPGSYDVSLKSYNPIGCEEEYVLTNYINVEASPVADFTSDTAVSSCYPLPVNFTNTSSLLNTITFNRWDFGDNTPISQFKDAFHNYTSVGKFDVTLIVGTNAGCKDTITKTEYIQTNGPEASIIFYPDSICINETITYEMVNPSGVDSFIWDFGDGESAVTNPATHRYVDKAGPTYPTLILSDSTGECTIGIKDTVYIKEMIALIGVTDTIGCEPFIVDFTDNSLNTSSSFWKLYDGNTSTQSKFTRTFSAGSYPIQLITEGLGCFDTTAINLKVFPKPRIQIAPDTAICEGDSIQLFGSGAPNYTWQPSDGLSNPLIPNPLASPFKSTNYKLTVKDSNECATTDSLLLTVYNRPLITLEPDSLIYLGEKINIVKENNQANVIYSWTPPTGLSCDDCSDPIAKPLVSTWYYLKTTDPKGCFEITDSIFIDVYDGFTAELPTAFSPNGDGNNDIIFVKGWGIKELLVYQIYNRWGELVFESNNLEVGWDGTYKGQPQAMDTYIYVIKALGYNDQVIEKKGNITLLR